MNNIIDNQAHIPILYNEIEDLIKKLKPHTVIDCTFGGGGHTNIFLKHGCKVVGFDYNIDVYNNIIVNHKNIDVYNNIIANEEINIDDQTSQNIKVINKNFTFIHSSFSNIDKYNIKADFIFADLGVSSMQIDEQNGFAFNRNTLLEMCGDSLSIPLYKKLPTLKYNDIYRILHEYGEVKNCNIISTNINNYNLLQGIKTTEDLVKATGLNPNLHFHKPILAQVFQAFRIYNNNEIDNLRSLMSFITKNNTNFGIIGFHSIEARLIKQMSINLYNINYCIKPSTLEIEKNTRSRSAILRICIN